MKDKFRVGLIRVLTSDDQDFVNIHGNIIMEHFPGIEVISKCIPDQWEGIHDDETEAIAIPKIVKTAHEFEDIDMIIVSCADDPGVEELRKEFPNIPVTGGGETTVAVASKYGKKFGVLGIIDDAPHSYHKHAADKLHTIKRPEGVYNAVDLLTPGGIDGCVASAKQMAEEGADVIALACTGLTNIGVASGIEKEVGIPVVDPVIAEGLFAYFESIKRKL